MFFKEWIVHLFPLVFALQSMVPSQLHSTLGSEGSSGGPVAEGKTVLRLEGSVLGHALCQILTLGRRTIRGELIWLSWIICRASSYSLQLYLAVRILLAG